MTKKKKIFHLSFPLVHGNIFSGTTRAAAPVLKGGTQMLRFMFHCKRIFKQYSKDEVGVYAAQASFFIILATFPFLMLLISLIHWVPMVQVSDLMSFLIEVIPPSFAPLLIQIIDSLHSRSSMTILSVTALTSLWSASQGMLGIERGLNRICNVEDKRNYFVRRLLCTGYTVLFTIVCVLSLVFLVFGSSLQNLLIEMVPALAASSFLALRVRGLFTVAALIAFFLAIYTALPYRHMPIRYQIPGAVFSAVGWAVFSFAFSIYFRYFNRYTIMYGSLTAIILLMLWLYCCMCILFVGAEINWYLHGGSRKQHHK